MKLFKVTLVLAAVALLFAQADSALQRAIRKETLEGDLKGAIESYKKLTQGRDRAVAAKALVRMGQCYEKLGDAEARKAYERVVREFGDQKDSVEAARVRLAALRKPAVSSEPTLRLIGTDGWVIGPSRDGRVLLECGPNGDLDLRDLQTGQIRHIAKRACFPAAVSSDGRQVAFVRGTDDALELRVVGADGSGERVLRKLAKGSAGALQWFPDSKRIKVTAWAKQATSFVAVSATDGSVTTLWEGKRLNDPGELSPDGKAVVYSRRARENPVADELWLFRLEDRSEVLLFEGQSAVACPRWTPDGTGVVFFSDRRAPGTIVDLWLLQLSGGSPLGFPKMIKTDLGEMDEGYPTTWAFGPITRDGTYYFHRRKGGDAGMRQLLTTQFDPSTGKVVGTPAYVSRKGGQSHAPSFSRDGRWLAYVSQFQNLVIQSVESGEETVVPLNPSATQLNWAVMFPDGRSVLVAAQHPKDGWGIYRVDAASGAWTSLKKPGESEVQGFLSGISPDGKTVYLTGYGAGSTNQVARDIETGQERELTAEKGGRVSWLSHDGKQLAVTHPDGKDIVIEVLPTAGGPKREIYRAPGVQGFELTWTPDGRYFICIPTQGPANAKGYLRVSVEGGEAQFIGISAPEDGPVKFPRSFGAVRVHPNGRQIVYTARGDDLMNSGREDWALENFLPGLKTSK